MKMKKNSGFVLLEVLIAIGLLILFLGSLGTLFILNLRGTALINNINQAELLARSNLDALRTISFSDLSLIDPAHLVFSGSNWTTVAGEEVGEVFTKTVRVKEVQRDSSCNIVTSGGTVDIDSKTIESEVNWTDLFGRNHQTLLTGLVTNWADPQGSCFKYTAAAHLVFHTESTLWYGGKQLRQLYLENAGDKPFTISNMVFTWNNTANIQQVFLDSTKLWSSSGPGTPTGVQPSDTNLNVIDYTMNPGETLDMNKTQFDLLMADTTLILTITFTDGSVFVSDPFTPSSGGSGSGTSTCFTGSNLNFYIPFKASTSGDYPTKGTVADSVTVRTSSPTSSGYLNIGLSFGGISPDILDPIIYLTFSDLDLHTKTFTSGGNKATGSEAFILKDSSGSTLASLDTSYPDSGSFTWSQSLSTDLFAVSPTTFTLRLSTLIQLTRGTTFTVSNSMESISNIKICGTVP